MMPHRVIAQCAGSLLAQAQQRSRYFHKVHFPGFQAQKTYPTINHPRTWVAFSVNHVVRH